jgi:hypothetical protein
VKPVFFPLDRQLGLVKHSWTPETIKEAVGLGAEIPSYRRAAAKFAALTKIPLSKSSLQALSLSYGGRLVQRQAEEAEGMVKPPAPGEEIVWRDIPEPDSPVMAVSLDGVMLNIIGEGWKEVRVATVAAVEPHPAAAGETEPAVQLTKISYRAGLWEAKAFAKQQWAEGCRRGLEKAKHLVSVNDGALWIWLIIAMCWAPCQEILDWWHLLAKVWAAANSLLGQGQAQTAVWMKAQKSHLWAGHPRAVLRAIRQLVPRGQPLTEPLQALLSYFFHHRHRLAYATYRQAGYPIGSGSVEAGCKVVVEARMKQAGMRWSRHGAQAMLALRSVLLSERWDELWPSLLSL